MEPVSNVKNSAELLDLVRGNVDTSLVLQDKSYRRMDVVLIAILIQEHQQMVSNVFLILVLHDKDLDQMDLVLIVQPTKELKDQV